MTKTEPLHHLLTSSSFTIRSSRVSCDLSSSSAGSSASPTPCTRQGERHAGGWLWKQGSRMEPGATTRRAGALSPSPQAPTCSRMLLRREKGCSQPQCCSQRVSSLNPRAMTCRPSSVGARLVGSTSGTCGAQSGRSGNHCYTAGVAGAGGFNWQALRCAGGKSAGGGSGSDGQPAVPPLHPPARLVHYPEEAQVGELAQPRRECVCSTRQRRGAGGAQLPRQRTPRRQVRRLGSAAAR